MEVISLLNSQNSILSHKGFLNDESKAEFSRIDIAYKVQRCEQTWNSRHSLRPLEVEVFEQVRKLRLTWCRESQPVLTFSWRPHPTYIIIGLLE